MKDFVKLIEKIGFKEVTGDMFNKPPDNTKIYYKFGNWRIDIRILSDRFIDWGLTSDRFIDWGLTYSDHNPNPLDRVEVTHMNIPFDDIRILKKYFISEIRDIKLDILFDEQKSLAQRVKELGI